MQVMDLSAGGFGGANLSFTVAKVATGDGQVNVGAIVATGQNLGNVNLPGDLGQIDVGTNDTKVPALKSLSVNSLGVNGLATQGGVGDLFSDINGSLGTLKVKTDVNAATINLVGGTGSKLGSASIGGSLIGGSTTQSGDILSTGDIGSVRIGGDLIGSTGGSSGEIQNDGALGSVTVGGSLIGGVGAASGEIGSGTSIGAIKIGHEIQGGIGDNSGSISTSGKIASITVGGSVVGGTGTLSGSIFSGGPMGAVSIAGNLQGNTGESSGHIQADSTVTSIRIGGSLFGGGGDLSGQIQLNGNSGPITIGGDIKGDAGSFSGQIQENGTVGGLKIGGSLIGGSGDLSGEIQNNMASGAVTIGHDLRGGGGIDSGAIIGTGAISKLNIGGSVVGGSASFTGSVFAGDIPSISILGSLIGSSVTGSDSLTATGEIVGRHIGTAFIGGSIISGIDNSTGSLTDNAGIRASQDIGSLVVAGSLIGNTTALGDTPVIISGEGQASPTATSDIAIGSITIGGQVEHSLILGGYTTSIDLANTKLSFANNNAQIGSVKVGGDWIASSLASGTVDVNNDGFGNADDTTNGTGVISKIASIIIGGTVTGTPAAGDHFGFESHQIGTFRYQGFTAPLSAAIPGQVIELSPVTGDVTIREI